MTEADWNSSTDPTRMLAFLRDSGRLSERKARLFAAATCRRFGPLVDEERFRRAVETIEQYADRLTSKAALKRARQAVRAARHGLSTSSPQDRTNWAAYWLAEVGAGENMYTSVAAEMQRLTDEGILDSSTEGQSAGPALLRDLFGPLPFSPARLGEAELAWNGGCVVNLAQAAYECRRLPAGTLENERLGVLADALEEAGCQARDILAHLRSPGRHVRGCWAVDLILSKE
jgi:hypothetical protein